MSLFPSPFACRPYTHATDARRTHVPFRTSTDAGQLCLTGQTAVHFTLTKAADTLSETHLQKTETSYIKNLYRITDNCQNPFRRRRMPSSGLLSCVTPVRSDVSDEVGASINRVTRIGELGSFAVTSNRRSHTV
jgi:hypothetical protein